MKTDLKHGIIEVKVSQTDWQVVLSLNIITSTDKIKPLTEPSDMFTRFVNLLKAPLDISPA